MTLLDMPKGVVGDQNTKLTSPFNASTDTTINVADATVFPDATSAAPNYASVRMPNKSCLVTFQYTGKSGNQLTGLTILESDLTIGLTATYPAGSKVYWSITKRLLDNIIDNVGSGGGGGTTNYNLLSNKPKIAGTELIGDLSLDTLGICKNTWASTDVGKVLTIGSDYKVYAQTGGGAAVWGGITGTLSDQADLNAELNTINGNITSLSGTIAAHTASIASLGNQISTARSDISTLQTAVSNKVSISSTTTKSIEGIGFDSSSKVYVEIAD